MAGEIRALDRCTAIVAGRRRRRDGGVVDAGWRWRGTRQPRTTDHGKPNFNGVWQALNEAHWDLRGARSSRRSGDAAGRTFRIEYARVPAAPVLALGSAGGVPASLGVVEGDGQIPYTPEAPRSRRRMANTGSTAIRS